MDRAAAGQPEGLIRLEIGRRQQPNRPAHDALGEVTPLRDNLASAEDSPRRRSDLIDAKSRRNFGTLGALVASGAICTVIPVDRMQVLFD